MAVNIQRKPSNSRSGLKVSAAEANRNFSKLLRDVQDGATITITSRGKPVAVMSAVDAEAAATELEGKERAWRDMIAEWRRAPLMHLGTFNRDDCYD
jgi:prevent-host-death family protein